MSKKVYNKSNIRHRSLNGSGQKYKSAASLKATNTTYVKTTKKSSRPAPVVQKTKENTKTAPDGKSQAASKALLEPAFLTDKSPRKTQDKSSGRNYRWGLVIPAIAVVLCLALFVIGSQAGWLQTFLTPQSQRIVQETTTPETTTQKETETETTTEEPTTETTTEETTTEFVPSQYVIYVNLGYNRVTVYTRGEKLNDGADPGDPLDDEYDLIPEIAFTCSPGVDGSTPTGTFYLQNRATWCAMIHDVYTQYATRIVDDVMFHSIPYLSENPGDLATYDYNILGQDASSACIRLNVRDAAWIFNNCAEGTEVDIFYDYTWPGPVDPEPVYQIPDNMEPLSNWDPTDIYSPGNPWLSYEAYLGSQDVTLPSYSSPDALLMMLSPTDDYGHNLSGYFHTDGGYDLTTPGTYYTTGYINIGNFFGSFPITITVTEEYADNTLGYYDEYGDFIYYETYDEYDGDEYTEDEYTEDGYTEDGYTEDGYTEDGYTEDGYTEDGYTEDGYTEDGYSEDTGEGYDVWYNEGEVTDYGAYDAAGPEGEDIQYSEDW